MSNMMKSTLNISIQLSINKLTVVLEDAEIEGLDSRMRMTIEEVTNKSLAQLIDELKFDVRIRALKKLSGEGKFEKFEAGIIFTSPNPNAFQSYICDTNFKSKELKQEIRTSLFKELEKEITSSDVNLGGLKLGFTSWDTGSLHIMLY